jgi:hypothetical protein
MEIPKGTTSCATTTDCPIISLTFTPAGIAADGSGNIWVTDDTSSGSVTEITSAAVSNASCSSCNTYNTSGYFSSPVGIAADGSSNIWVTNNSGNSVTEITSTAIKNASCSFSCTTFSNSSTSYFSSPLGIVADGSGNIWVTNDTSSGSVTEITSTATSCSSSSSCPTYPGFSNPVAVTAPEKNDVPTSGGSPWVANYSGGSLAEMDSTCSSQSGCPVIKGFEHPVALAFDPSGNLWAVDAGTSQLYDITANAIANASCVSASCYFYSLPAVPLGVASDGLGNIWVTLQNGQVIKFTP